jgi:hypothetical protein
MSIEAEYLHPSIATIGGNYVRSMVRVGIVIDLLLAGALQTAPMQSHVTPNDPGFP